VPFKQFAWHSRPSFAGETVGTAFFVLMLCESGEHLFPGIPDLATVEVATERLLLQQAIHCLDQTSIQNLFPLSDPDIPHFLQTEAIPHLLRSFSTAPQKSQPEIACFLKFLLANLGDENVAVKIILQTAGSSDSRLRLLAVSLIPLVQHPVAIRNCAFALTLDRVPSVRIEILRCLRDSFFDQRTVDAMLRNGLKDSNEQVRNTAIELVPEIAPHLLTEFGMALENSATVESALRNLRRLAQNRELNGLERYLAVALKLRPELFVTTLIDCLAFFCESENSIIRGFIEDMVPIPMFRKNCALFSRFVEDKTCFVPCFDLSSVTKWRDRLAIVRQAIEFVPHIGDSLVEVAVASANDETAIVRDASVSLWLSLIRESSGRAGHLRKLMGDNWQVRLVAAKVIGECGVIPEVWEQAVELSGDPVSNVRFGLAVRIRGADVFDKLFGGSEDAAIQGLRCQ
jgi:hypothetical protein